MDEIKSLFWDSVSVFLSKIFLILLMLFSIALTTRLLGLDGYGRLALLISVAQVFFLFGLSWTGTAMLRFGKEEFVLSKRINRTFWSRNLIMFTSLLLSILVIYFSRKIIFSFTGTYNWLLLPLIFVYVVSLQLSGYKQQIMQSINKIKLYALIQPIERIFIILGLCLIAWKVLPVSVYTVILIFISANIICSLSLIISFKKYLLPVVIDFQYVKRMLRFSYPLILGVGNTYLFYWFGVILIKNFMTIEDVGIYSLAKNGANIVEQITMSTTVVTIPLVISLAYNKKEHLIKKYIQKVIPYGILAIALSLSAIILFSKPLIHILGGQKFERAILPFAGLLVGYAGSGITSLYTPLIINYELIKESVKADILATVLHVLIAFLLIPRIGINGAVLAAFVHLYTGVVLRMYIIKRHLKIATFHYLFLTIPIFLSFLFFVRQQGLQSFILGILTIAVALYYLKRRFAFFNKADLWIVEHIDMPSGLKKLIRNIFNINSKFCTFV